MKEKFRLYFSLFCFISKAPICMMLPVLFFSDIYSLIVLQISGLFLRFTSFTAIVYLFSSSSFVTSIPYVIESNYLSFTFNINYLVFWIQLCVYILHFNSNALTLLKASYCFLLPSMFHSRFPCTSCFSLPYFLKQRHATLTAKDSYSESPTTHSGCKGCHAFIPAFDNKFNNPYSRNM